MIGAADRFGRASLANSLLKGSFSIGDSKETAYAVYDALYGENPHNCHRVRLSLVHPDEVIQHAREGKE